MKSSITAASALTGLLGITSAAPAQSPNVAKYQLNRSLNNYCGNSSFENQTTGGSPLVSDCQKMSRNIAGGGDWKFGAFQRQLVQYGSCAFGIVNDYSEAYIKIGNQDIMDIVRDSINKFQWQGKVGAKGRMKCETGYDVTWGLYHT